MIFLILGIYLISGFCLSDCGQGGDGDDLLQAAGRGKANVVRRILNCGKVDVNHVNSYGETGLWLASYHGHHTVVKMFLASPGIKVNLAKLPKKIGCTPLCIAAEKGQSEVVKQLLSSPLIDVNQATTGGSTPLSKAAYFGRVGVIKLLLADPRVDLNQRASNLSYPANMPPIGIAAHLGRLDVVKLLLRCPKTDISFRIEGYTLVDAAKRDVHVGEKYRAEYLGVPLGSDSEIRQRKKEIVNAIQSRPALLDKGHTCPK